MNKKFFACFFLLIFSGLLIGCGGGGGGSNPVAPATSTGAVANLTGLVKFENQPLANARVYLYPSESAHIAGLAKAASVRTNLLAQALNQDGSYFTNTDEAGRYNFTNIPVGEYTLIAAKDQNHQFAQTGVLLGAVTQLDAQLTPTGAISGFVKSNNNNVAGAIVYLDGTSYVAVTGIDGRYTIANVPANQSFVIKVIANQGELITSPTVTVEPGQTTSVADLVLTTPTVEVGTINGSLAIAGVAAPDPILANHMVLLTSDNQSPLINVSDDSGNFSFTVKTAGTYRVTAIPENYTSTPLYQDVSITLGNSATLAAIFELQSDVFDEERFMVQGNVLKTRKAFNETNEAGVPVILIPSDPAISNFATVSAPDGSFSFDVPAGEYELAVGGGYDFAAPLSENPFTVTADYTFATTIELVPTSLLYTVKGNVLKTAYAFKENDAGGVALTLSPTDGSNQIYSAVSDATGAFAFQVPAGEYELRAGGAYVLDDIYTGNLIPINIADNYVFTESVSVKPSAEELFKITGYVSKTVKAFNEPDDGNVTIYLNDTGLTLQPQVSVTAPGGEFSFVAPAGEYTLSVGGFYEFVDPQSPFVLAADRDFLQLNIRPIGQVGGSVSGLIQPTNAPGNFEIRLEETASAYVDVKFVAPSVGSYRFDDVPPGDYRVLVLPSQTPFYDESAIFTINPGENVNVDLNAFPVDPNITGATANFDFLDISGERFASLPVNPATTRILVDGIERPRPAAFTPSDTVERAEIGNIEPGPHQVVIKKAWTRPGTTDVYALTSQAFRFDKPIRPPQNLQVQKVTNDSVSFSWQNAEFTQKTEVEIYDLDTAASVVLEVVPGNFYDYQGLNPTTNYEIRVKNIANGQVSTLVIDTFVTKSPTDFQIQQFTLANSGTRLTAIGEPLGFTSMNGVYYVCYASESGTAIYSYNQTGAELDSVTLAGISALRMDQISMVAGDGRIFLAYYDGSGMVVNAYNPNLTVSDSRVFSSSLISEGSLLYAGNRLFFAYSEYPLSAGTTNHYLTEIDLADFSIINVRQNFSSTTLLDSGGFHIKACADQQNIYIAYPFNSGTYEDRFEIGAVPITTPDGPISVIATMTTYAAGGENILIRQMKIGGGKIMFRHGDQASVGTEFMHLIETASGYKDDRSASGAERGDYAVDSKGRTWMAETRYLPPSSSDNFFIQIAPDGTVIKSLRVENHFFIDVSVFPNPAEFIKVDPVTGSMNMLFVDSQSNLSVYRYTSDF